MIIKRSRDELAKMARAGRVVAEVLDLMESMIAPGTTTEELDDAAEALIRERKGIPTFLGYQGFPKSICASANDVVVHGIPDATRLQAGDIIGVDVGVTLEGYVADAARTYAVGRIGDEARRLMTVTSRSLTAGIEMCRPGRHLSDIGHAVQTVVEAAGFSVVVQFVGHGIGRNMHEEPQIPNFGPAGRGPRLEEGMVFAIEPMVNAGLSEVVVMEDGWTVRTADGRRSAHFEHTVAVTAGGPEILTL
ncbi:MAG: type I methionyl aminopeptidase [Candidatus Geothermincolia bacterium]